MHCIAGPSTAGGAVVVAGRDERPFVIFVIDHNRLVFLPRNSYVEPCVASLAVTFHGACPLASLLPVRIASIVHLQLVHCGPIERVGRTPVISVLR